MIGRRPSDSRGGVRAIATVALLVGCAAPPVARTGAADGGCVEGQAVLPGILVNARDLGGLPTSSGPLACGHVFRAAAPGALTGEGCARFAELGIETVIDLRTPAERQSVPTADCVAPASRTVFAPMPIPYSVSPADYLADLHSDAAVRAVFDALADRSRYPVLIHCTYGRDRSGVAVALVLLARGATREVILRDYQRTAENGLSAFPASLEAVLDEVERAGGIDAFLAPLGITAESLAALRSL